VRALSRRIAAPVCPVEQWRVSGDREDGDGLANAEEDYADNAAWDLYLMSRDTHVMPWRIEDELKEARRELRAGGPLAVVRDSGAGTW
jgi:hypothetical protein